MWNLLMGNKNSYQKINFEDVKYSFNKPNYIMINTLPESEQEYLISGTIPCSQEERIINHLISNVENKNIIIYGKNSNDETIYNKYDQLKKLGIINIYIYSGGLFEWSLLQDIYTSDNFPTTCECPDILKFKPLSAISLQYIES